MTPSQFLEAHANFLKDAGFEYSFLRNAEGYPEKITGDVDVLVERRTLAVLASYFGRLGDNVVRVVQMLRKPRDLYVMLYFPASDDRKFLVIEYFSGLIFRNREILSAEWLLKRSVPLGIWRRLPDDISITFTFLHYLIYKGELPEKYQPLLDAYGLHSELLEKISGVLRAREPGIQVANPNSQPRLLRQQLRGLVSRLDIARGYLAQAVAMRPNSLGARIFVNPRDVKPLLEFADKYHLFRPTYRYGLDKYGPSQRAKSVLIVLLGGLAVVADSSVPPSSNVSRYIELFAERRQTLGGNF